MQINSISPTKVQSPVHSACVWSPKTASGVLCKPDEYKSKETQIVTTESHHGVQYTQSDPLGLSAGANLYRYGNGNPNRFLDEHGLYCTSDFVRHYFRGGGIPNDLGSMGLLGGVRRSADVVHIEANLAIHARRWSKALSIALCVGGRCGSFSRSFTNSKRYAADLTNEPCLFAVGNTTIFGEADCRVKANCDTSRFQYSCNLKYGLRDVFKDPLDIYDLFPGEMEVGTPYNIVADWANSISGTGSF